MKTITGFLELESVAWLPVIISEMFAVFHLSNPVSFCCSELFDWPNSLAALPVFPF